MGIYIYIQGESDNNNMSIIYPSSNASGVTRSLSYFALFLFLRLEETKSDITIQKDGNKEGCLLRFAK